MFSFDMNKKLWRDAKTFELFMGAVSSLRQATSRERYDAKEFLEVSNVLDDIMQSYENRYGSIEDPIFFWSFATANAMFLQVGKRFDKMGSTRIAYIVNGYKEGLNKHLLYPSYPEGMMQSIFGNMAQFANEEDREWISINRDKFVPVPG